MARGGTVAPLHVLRGRLALSPQSPFAILGVQKSTHPCFALLQGTRRRGRDRQPLQKYALAGATSTKLVKVRTNARTWPAQTGRHSVTQSGAH